MRDLLSGLMTRWPLLILAALIYGLLALPSQVHELYRIAAQGPLRVWSFAFEDPLSAAPYLALLASALIAPLLIGGTLWLAARHPAYGAEGRGGRLAALALAALPIAAGAHGLWAARPTAIDVSAEMVRSQLERWRAYGTDLSPAAFEALVASHFQEVGRYPAVLAGASLTLCGALLALLALFALSERHRRRHPVARIAEGRRRIWGYALALGVFLLAVLLTWLTTTAPVAVADWSTPFLLIAAFVAASAAAATLLTDLSRRLDFPVLGAVLAGVAVLGALELNAKHRIRGERLQRGAAAEAAAPAPPTLAQAFERWRRSRGARTTEGPEEVFLVAAQGGGIYAAYHSARFLTESFQDCPLFGRQLFAISAVSGGSVGAAGYQALIADQTSRRTPLAVEDAVCARLPKARYAPPSEFANRMYLRDYWTPLQAALMFPDFLQRFLFIDVPSFDRSRALEKALEHHSIESGRVPQETNLLLKPYLESWAPEARPFNPALILNATDVGTGQRRVFSPFLFCAAKLEFFPVWPGEASQLRETTLSAAAIVSARFPWATPAAAFRTEHQARCLHGVPRLERQDKGLRPVRVVDGGYFENSGVATAIDIAIGLRDYARTAGANLRVHLIILTSAGFEPQKFFGFHESLSPIRTLLNTQVSRADFEIDRAEALFELGRISENFEYGMLLKFELQGAGFELPLGWRLSVFNSALIDVQNGSEDICGEQALLDWREDPSEGLSGSCVKKLVYACLRGAASCAGPGRR